jgi:uncharacterized membrane protein (UPF0127 family)
MKNFTSTANPKSVSNNFLRDDAKLSVKETVITVEIADTQETRSKGLSGKEKIADNEGMLFTSNVPSFPTFWMKDMKFPLDFIWITGDKIVDIIENVPNPESQTPEKDLPLYKPNQAVDKVLEVNAGFVSTNNIKVGDSVTISYK